MTAISARKHRALLSYLNRQPQIGRTVSPYKGRRILFAGMEGK